MEMVISRADNGKTLYMLRTTDKAKADAAMASVMPKTPVKSELLFAPVREEIAAAFKSHWPRTAVSDNLVDSVTRAALAGFKKAADK